ncbi:hypothetical protein BT69DRAFT_763806 [Atractiella rhizophila]|nr:hypothetical protein BT69DRAFT_763806 [Atractiella rhizophila]
MPTEHLTVVTSYSPDSESTSTLVDSALSTPTIAVFSAMEEDTAASELEPPTGKKKSMMNLFSNSDPSLSSNTKSTTKEKISSRNPLHLTLKRKAKSTPPLSVAEHESPGRAVRNRPVSNHAAIASFGHLSSVPFTFCCDKLHKGRDHRIFVPPSPSFTGARSQEEEEPVVASHSYFITYASPSPPRRTCHGGRCGRCRISRPRECVGEWERGTAESEEDFVQRLLEFLAWRWEQGEGEGER